MVRWSTGLLCLAGLPSALGFTSPPAGTVSAAVLGVGTGISRQPSPPCGVTALPSYLLGLREVGAGVLGGSAGLTMSAEREDRRVLLGRVVLPAASLLLAGALFPGSAEAAAGAKKPEALITGPVGEGVIAPTDEQTEVIRRAFRAFGKPHVVRRLGAPRALLPLRA